MKRYFIAVVVLAGLALLRLETATHADPKAEQAATSSAEAWLSLVDQGKYAESWDQAAQLFRGAATRDKWKESLTAVRTPMGKVLSRKLKSRHYTESIPGAPDGKYVIIQYETSFQNKKAAVETITPMFDRDGKWRVAGYFIK